jgi:hypothetical protein
MHAAWFNNNAQELPCPHGINETQRTGYLRASYIGSSGAIGSTEIGDEKPCGNHVPNDTVVPAIPRRVTLGR